MCDTLCAIGTSGLVFAKNSDRPPDEAQVFEAHPRRPAGGTLRTQYLQLADTGAAAVCGSRPTWLWGMEHGFNEHGVAIGNEKIWTTGRPRARPAALLGMDLVRLGLERSRTADDALSVITELIEAHGQGGSGERDRDEPYDSSFLIADPRRGWVLETCDRTWVARPVTAGAALSNRISLESDWTQSSADVAPGADFQAWRHPKVPTGIADHRLAVTRACVTRGADEITPAAIVATLRDHGAGPWGTPEASSRERVADPVAPAPVPLEPGADYHGVTVCMHVRGIQTTTASMVCAIESETRTTRAWVALGSPCASIYVPVFPGVGVPRELGEATTWSRFGTLRDRVDATPEALPQVRAVLAPVESELWERAEFAAGDPRTEAEYTERAFAPVEHALHDLGL